MKSARKGKKDEGDEPEHDEGKNDDDDDDVDGLWTQFSLTLPMLTAVPTEAAIAIAQRTPIVKLCLENPKNVAACSASIPTSSDIFQKLGGGVAKKSNKPAATSFKHLLT